MDNGTEVATTEGSNQLSTTIVYTVFGIFGIAGNGLVLLVISLGDDLNSVTNLFIANQSLIDFLTSVFIIALYVVPLPPIPIDRPTLARFLCRFWYTGYPFWSLIVASSLNLTLMTLERFCAVFFPIRFRSQSNSRYMKLIASLPWAIGFLFQLSSGFFAHLEDNRCIFTFFSNPLFRRVFQPVAIFLEFILPVLVMLIVYTAIVIKLRSNGMRAFDSPRLRKKVGAASRPQQAIDYRSRARRNTIKTMLIVSLFFIVCWSLNQVLFLVFSCCGGGVDLNSLLYQISVFMGFGNMWINPFIYSFQYRWFQKGLRKVFCKKTRSRHSKEMPTISTAKTSSNETVSV